MEASEKNITQKRGRLATSLLILSAMGGIATIVTASILINNQWFNIPKITYQIFPPYELPSPLSGCQVVYVFIKNSGPVSATKFVFSIITSGPIVSASVNSYEPDVNIEPWQNQTKLKFSQSRLGPNDWISITLIISTTNTEPIVNVYSQYDQGQAVKEEVAQTPWGIILAVIFAVIDVIGIPLGYLLGRSSAFNDVEYYNRVMEYNKLLNQIEEMKRKEDKD